MAAVLVLPGGGYKWVVVDCGCRTIDDTVQNPGGGRGNAERKFNLAFDPFCGVVTSRSPDIRMDHRASASRPVSDGSPSKTRAYRSGSFAGQERVW